MAQQQRVLTTLASRRENRRGERGQRELETFKKSRTTRNFLALSRAHQLFEFNDFCTGGFLRTGGKQRGLEEKSRARVLITTDVGNKVNFNVCFPATAPPPPSH